MFIAAFKVQAIRLSFDFLTTFFIDVK